MNKNLSLFLRWLSLVLILGLLSGLGLAIVSFLSIQSVVRETFGPPALDIGYAQKITLSTILFLHKDQLLSSRSPDASPRTFSVDPQEQTTTILNRLVNEGFIDDPLPLRAYLQYTGMDKNIQSGNHLLSPAMSPIQLAQAISSYNNLLVQFTLLPGWRIEEIADALVASGILSNAQEFIQLASHPQPVYLPLSEAASLEGFLFPDSYSLQKQSNPEQLIAIFIQRFQANLTPDLAGKFERQGLSPYQALILASMVQRESIVKEEMPLIASVFFNRLQAGMKLDSDPTVQYALGYNHSQKTWWTNPLSKSDLEINSPYNTYLYIGLPPTPICNPGLDALLAVAQPQPSDYYYFRASCNHDGRHTFSRTYEEHLNNACP